MRLPVRFLSINGVMHVFLVEKYSYNYPSSTLTTYNYNFTSDSDNFCTKPSFFKDDTLFIEVLYHKGTAV